MKVFADNVIDDKALDRVSSAIKRYAPAGITIVSTEDEADLVVMYVFGRRRQFKSQAERLASLGKKYAVMQVALRSTTNPLTQDWMPIWNRAVLVWSYYDLPALSREDGNFPDFAFYHSPLGVGAEFSKKDREKEYVVATSGHGYLTESVRECIHAAASVGKKVFHIGPVVTDKPGVDFADGMSDIDLAGKLSACEFVSGLRRKEGFELPVVEGLVCGARPVVFEKPHYRKWFEDFAVFIPETGRDDIVKSLIAVFDAGAKPVKDGEIEKAREIFDWEKIAGGFWSRIEALT